MGMNMGIESLINTLKGLLSTNEADQSSGLMYSLAVMHDAR
jgi:hypothetical protein